MAQLSATTLGTAISARSVSARQSHLDVEHLSLAYHGRSGPTLALDDISFVAAKGEFVAIVGPSGCGKSSLLKIACGLVEPTGGTLTIGGSTPAEAREQANVGLVFQNPVLLEWRTALANARLGLELTGRKTDYHVAEELIRLVGLERFAQATPSQLSGGMRQRVAIARALALQPELLLMDEPFGALDEFTRADLGQELLRIWGATGCTVIFVTHSIDEAVTLADRILVFSSHPGRLIGEVAVQIPRPRDDAILESDAAFTISRRVRRLLREAHPAKESSA